mmetsp:Transcript_3886/g.7803  ORF Transcript_3886/g.7803 Transcript_3886/m.7803 type:complete len:363 (+) Transcript_3886:58-1146(+)
MAAATMPTHHRMRLLPALGIAAATLAAIAWHRRAKKASLRAAVLVVGGSGLMGAPTVRRLVDQGHHVVVLTRGREQGQGTAGKRPELASLAKRIVCDRGDADEFKKVLSDPDCPRIVVDFAAMLPEHIEAVLAAHGERPLDHYVFISTNMVYPGGPEKMDISSLAAPVSEDRADIELAELAPDSYGGRKLKCEALLQRAFACERFPVTVLRPPAVVGPGCDHRHERLQRHVEGLPPLAPRPRAVLATQPGRFRVAYSGDVAQTVSAVIARGRSVHGEAFNVACDDSLTLSEYVAAMAQAAGCELAPAAPEDPSSRNYELQGLIDISKAQTVLGFQPTPVSAWMPRTVAWHAPILKGAAPAAL